MRGPIILGSRGRAALLLVAAALMLSGCNAVKSLLRPELAACETFARGKMKAPDSFHRVWSNISDFPVTRDMLVEATGDAAAAKATNPAIRKVVVQYEGSDNTGGSVGGVAVCRFALSDAGSNTYVKALEDSVEAAIHENEQRTLAMSIGTPGVVAADCCLAPHFDVNKLAAIKRHDRGTVSAAGRKL